VLSGGEIAAMALIDACVRTLPGVMGTAASGEEESFSRGLLEYPHYTRPQVWEGRAIPEVLLSGDHGRIAAWRYAEAERLTRERRPDLWARRASNQPLLPDGQRPQAKQALPDAKIGSPSTDPQAKPAVRPHPTGER
jgi:tRNA (guanine37-N1)-methyltransferase